MDLKIKDVAELLNVSEKTVRRWLEDGKIPAYQLNEQYRFSRLEIENWMVNFKKQAQEEGIYATSPDSQQRGGQQQFSLYRAIHQGEVFTHSKGKNKEEIIRTTTGLIAPRLGVDAEVLADLLLDRENLMPTAIGHGVGVPHTRDFILEGPTDMVVVVFPEKPLEYGALDGAPVHTLFFLFSSADKRHLHLLAKIAHLSSSAEAQKFLRTQPDKKHLLDFLKEWESHLK